MSIINNSAINNLKSQLNRMGENHITLNEQGNIHSSTSSFAGRVLNWIDSQCSKNSAKRNIKTLEAIAATVGENFGAGYEQAFTLKVQEKIGLGKPLSARKVVSVINELAKIKTVNDQIAIENSKKKNNQLLDTLFTPMDNKGKDKLAQILAEVGLTLNDVAEDDLKNISKKIKNLIDSRSEVSLEPATEDTILECLAEIKKEIQKNVNSTICKNIIRELEPTIESLLKSVYDKNDIQSKVSKLLVFEYAEKAISALHAQTLQDRCAPTENSAKVVINDVIQNFSNLLDTLPEYGYTDTKQSIRPFVAKQLCEMSNVSPDFVKAAISLTDGSIQSYLHRLIDFELNDSNRQVLETVKTLAGGVEREVGKLSVYNFNEKETRNLLNIALQTVQYASSKKIDTESTIRNMYKLQQFQNNSNTSKEEVSASKALLKYYSTVLLGVSNLKTKAINILLDKVPLQVFYPSQQNDLSYSDPYKQTVAFSPNLKTADNENFKAILEKEINELFSETIFTKNNNDLIVNEKSLEKLEPGSFEYDTTVVAIAQAKKKLKANEESLEGYFSPVFIDDYFRNYKVTINGEEFEASFDSKSDKSEEEKYKNLKELVNQFDGDPILAGKVLNILHQGMFAATAVSVAKTNETLEKLGELLVHEIPLTIKTNFDIRKVLNGTYNISIESAYLKHTGEYLQSRIDLRVSELTKDVPAFTVINGDIAYKL